MKISGGGPALASITTFGNRTVGIVASGVMLLGMMIGAYCAFPRMIANVALYQVITRISRPSIGSAMDYFYTADEMCLPGGPQFSFKYYITYTGITGAIVSFVTVWIYQALMSKWKFRTVLIVTLVMQCLGSIVDLIIVKRWNVAWGIEDKVFYVVGEAVLENVVGMLNWIPSSAILSKVCGSGMEATTFAFLAGVSNFGGMVSQLSGVAIFEAAGIKTLSPNCNFESLWWLILAFNIGLPLAAGIPSTWLIPDMRQTDQLIQGETPGTEIERDDKDDYIGMSVMSSSLSMTQTETENDDSDSIQAFISSSEEVWF